MLNVQSLSKMYQSHLVFEDISFHVKQGEVIGLIGENGAGKSTLLHILATLQKPSSGKIYLKDESYESNITKIRKQIGFVPQEIALWDEFTVRENMLFFSELSWKKRKESDLKAICKRMKLNKWNEKVMKLSGGMKRKLNLAIALIHQPSLLLLDEPTVGIDLKSKIDISSYLKSLAKDEGKTIIYISHDMDEITQLCDRVLCLGNDPFYKQYLAEQNECVMML